MASFPAPRSSALHGGRAFRPTARIPSRRDSALTALAAAAAAASVFAGAGLAAGGPKLAAALIVVPVIAIALFTRPFEVFALATAAAIAVPFYYTLGSEQLVAYRVVAAIVIAITLLVVAGRSTSPRPRLADLAVLAFLIASFASWWSDGGALKDVVNYLLPFAFYFGARLVRPERLWHVVWVVTGAGAIGALTVLYETVITRGPIFISPDKYLWNPNEHAVFRPGGVFSGPPVAVCVLSITALFGVALIHHHRGRARAAAIAMVLLSVAAALATFTRAGYIGLGLGLAIYVVLAQPKLLSPQRVFVMVAAAAAVGSVTLLPTVENSRWFQQGILRKGTLGARESYWALARPLVADTQSHLLVGHGVNSLLRGGVDRHGLGQKSLDTNPTLLTIGPHNQYIRILLEEGLVGLGLLLIWLLAPAVQVVARRRRLTPATRPIAAALVASIVSFMAVVAAGDMMRAPPALAAIAIATGLLTGIAASAPPGEEGRAQQRAAGAP